MQMSCQDVPLSMRALTITFWRFSRGFISIRVQARTERSAVQLLVRDGCKPAGRPRDLSITPIRSGIDMVEKE